MNRFSERRLTPAEIEAILAIVRATDASSVSLHLVVDRNKGVGGGGVLVEVSGS